VVLCEAYAAVVLVKALEMPQVDQVAVQPFHEFGQVKQPVLVPDLLERFRYFGAFPAPVNVKLYPKTSRATVYLMKITKPMDWPVKLPVSGYRIIEKMFGVVNVGFFLLSYKTRCMPGHLPLPG
jgi:hypothetical protein